MKHKFQVHIKKIVWKNTVKWTVAKKFEEINCRQYRAKKLYKSSISDRKKKTLIYIYIDDNVKV